MMSVFTGERQGEIGLRQARRRHRGEDDGEMKAETDGMQPHLKGLLEPPDRGKDGSSPRAFEGSDIAPLPFGLSNCEKIIGCFKLPILWKFVMEASRKEYTLHRLLSNVRGERQKGECGGASNTGL